MTRNHRNHRPSTAKPATCATLIALLAALLPTAALAHAGEHRVDLHEGYQYDNCYFDLHPELSKSQFRRFAAEAGQIVYFRQVSSAETLGQWNFDLGLTASYSMLDDTKPAWNNTMSHPGDDHYLGEQLLIPQLTLRVGITEHVDIEAYGTVGPGSNYGFVGVAAKVQVLDEKQGMPLSLSIRPSVSGLLGPAEVQVWNLGTDLAVSRRFGGLAPFAGVGLNTSVAIERSDDTDVGTQGALRAVPFAGLDYHWGLLSVGAQAEISAIPVVSARLAMRL